MKIKSLEADGFRSLVNFRIEFDDHLTVVVGENDSGKSSLIECLKVVTQGRSVAADDFTHGVQALVVKVETENFVYCKEYEGLFQRSVSERQTGQFVGGARSTENLRAT